MVLVMTVEPGFGGQKFLDLCLPKIRRARELIDKHGVETWLQVDGGVSPGDHRALRRGRRRRVRRRLGGLLGRRPRRDGRGAARGSAEAALLTPTAVPRGPATAYRRRRVADLDPTSSRSSRALGSVKFRPAVTSPRPGHSQWPVDQVELLDRRSKSGWEAHAGEAASVALDGATCGPPLDAPESATGPEGHEMTASAAERRAMRRALALAATPGVPLGPNPRVGCVLLDAGRRDRSPRASTAAPAPRTPRSTRWPRAGDARPRHHRRRHPRALQPHRPHRPVRRRRWSRPAYAAWCSPRPTPTRSPPAAPRPLRAAGVEVECGPAGRRGPGAQPGLDLRRRARPPVRHLEVRDHPRRPQRRRRRHQPLGQLAAPPASTPTGSGRCATRCWSAPTRSRSTTPQLTVRDEDDRPLAAPAAARGDGAARPRPRPPGPRRRAPRPSTCAPATPHEALAELFARDRQHVFLEGGPTLAAAFLRAGLVDEVVAYVAPMLLGAGRSAVADLGITTIADALHLDVTDVTVLGEARRRAPTSG